MIVNDNDSDCSKTGEELNLSEDTDKIKYLIQQLLHPQMPRTLEKNHDNFSFILKKYQDLPQMLDPYLDSFLSSLIQLIREKANFKDLNNYVFKYIYIIMSVKTYKKIAIHLPHEVSDFNRVLEMLEKQDIDDKDNWQTRYVLLIWLSIICKIPFALSRLDTISPLNENPQQSITLRVIEICKKYCASKDSCSIAGIYLVANFLTRSDVKDHYLEDMISWSLNNFQKDNLDHRPLAVIASIIKHSCRDDLVPYNQLILDKVLRVKLSNNSADLVRKYLIKIIQRIGTVLLKPNSPAWHYKKASKTINLYTHLNETSTIESADIDKKFSVAKIEDHEIPPCMEDLLEYLITGLQDKSLIIRWSAAKGIGRITARLPIDLADEVLGFVLNLFSSREYEIAWHGGCLALAELGRRGLLLPYRLEIIIPLVIKGLQFDEPRSHGPIGSIIRDAACFVCWSFARAFEPNVFEPYIEDITIALLIVTCFDRQINCRRAASAAFQEIVGRQGNFPNGIDIVSASDYLAVGVRSNAYLKISVFIANYEGYLEPFCEHLIRCKVAHWDIAIRELTAKALYNLAGLRPDYTINKMLPLLMDFLTSPDLCHCHGATLAIAEILIALHDMNNKDLIEFIEQTSSKIQDIVATFRNRGQFRGLGGEILKQACVTLIKNLSLMHFSIDSKNILNDWQDLLEECLGNEVSTVRIVSAEAQTAFLTEYYFSWSLETRHDIINRYLNNLFSTNQANRIGFAQAIGYFPVSVLEEKGQDIFKKLIESCDMTKETLLWAESRKEAINSLKKLCETLGLPKAEQWKCFLNDLYNCYFNGLADYTNDNRGDIGSWVREAAISAIFSLTNLVYQAGYSSVLTEELMGKIIGGISQQAVERIDRTRAKAGSTVYALIESELPNIPYHKELKTLFSNFVDGNDEMYIDWKSESETIPLFIEMLSFPPYISPILRGIIFSMGGLSESLVKYSTMSLQEYLMSINKEKFWKISKEMCHIFETSHGDDRMICASLAFLDRLMNGVNLLMIYSDPENEVAVRILNFAKTESKCVKTTQSQINIVKIFCHLLYTGGSTCKSAFSQLSMYLCHKFKYIRKTTAYLLYENFVLYGRDFALSTQDLATVVHQLNVVDWEQPVANLRPIRNELCKIMENFLP
ncbi:PREDICTED: tubulin-specific chaperone D [Ceratosolen solmsi marchali]|uniref:Tubulin-specific chaperone D n=1 Tax=Ceratosolen solmsi marchali TaxID=326594 RepID=A0AAJ6VMR9_9HYME|nr:PREDICTED: tubulin-specific chaperone D [Ceratosolen solmsi marchali]